MIPINQKLSSLQCSNIYYVGHSEILSSVCCKRLKLNSSSRQQIKAKGAYNDYQGTTSQEEAVNAMLDGQKHGVDIYELSSAKLSNYQAAVLKTIGVPVKYPKNDASRAVYCSRSLDLASIKVVGFDMDYTLVHYDVGMWEGLAYQYCVEHLRSEGWRLDGYEFDQQLGVRGLVIDTEYGNLVKVDRFGKVKRAMHGTKSMMTPQEMKSIYDNITVNLRDEQRWQFLNTLFSVSEACVYMQCVDLIDEGQQPQNIKYYADAYDKVKQAMSRVHLDGQLKSEIIQDPSKFVELDSDMAQVVVDMKASGKITMLITNSDWQYTKGVMTYAYDRYLPDGLNWRDMFDVVLVLANKPHFFSGNLPLYQVVSESGLLKPMTKGQPGVVLQGGSAAAIEKMLAQQLQVGCTGQNILYVGDHIYTDSALAKINMRWRTCLIVREIEEEVKALGSEKGNREELQDLLQRRTVLHELATHLKLFLQRKQLQQRKGAGRFHRRNAKNLESYDNECVGNNGNGSNSPKTDGFDPQLLAYCNGTQEGIQGVLEVQERQPIEHDIELFLQSAQPIDSSSAKTGQQLSSIDMYTLNESDVNKLSNLELLQIISRDGLVSEAVTNRVQKWVEHLQDAVSYVDRQLVKRQKVDGNTFNPLWGYLSRAGINDRSMFMKQIEKYADIYTSRVSNFTRYTPYRRFSSIPQTLYHEPEDDVQNIHELFESSFDQMPNQI